MQRISTALRCGLGFIVFGALLGAGVGVVLGIRLVSSNDYSQQAPRLARWALIDSTSDAMLQGALFALVVLAVFLLLCAALRIFLGGWRRAGIGAALAVPLIGLYLLAAWWINRTVLPAALSTVSIIGNLALASLAFAVWYASLRAVERRPLNFAFARTLPWARPLPLVAMVLVVLAVQSTRVVARPDPAQEAPHVLLIVIDALRPDRLGAYGYQRPTSPNLDRLAGEGWLFLNALSTAPWTKPAIASLFTGLYPAHHGISSAGWNLSGNEEEAASVSALPRSLLTLPEVLANAGYRTAAFGENHHLIARLGFDQGFEVHEMALRDSGALQSIARRLHLGVVGEWFDDPAGDNTAREINERFLGWLPAGDERFFGYLHHIDVHWPYRSPEPYAGQFGPRRTAVDFNSIAFYEAFGPERDSRDRPPALAAAVVEDMSDAYDEGVRFVDAELGALFAALEERDLYDRTLIIVTADHGEQFLEHGEIGHGTSLHDVLLRIPLIVKFPCPGEYCRQRKVTEQVQLVDIMPTILDVAGLPVPARLPGVSLAGRIPPTRVLFAEAGEEVALRTNEFKFIYHLDDSRAEMYALERDPAERNDLAASDPELALTFRDRMFVFLEESQRSAAAPREEVAADDAMLERLKSLGYLK